MSFVQLKDKDNNPIYPITTIKDIKYKGIDHKDTFMVDIDSSFYEINGKLDALKNEIKDIQKTHNTEITQIYSAIESDREEVKALKEEISNIKKIHNEEITQINLVVSNNKKIIDELINEVETLRNELNILKDYIYNQDIDRDDIKDFEDECIFEKESF